MAVAKWCLWLPHGGVEAAVVFTLFLLLTAKWNRSRVPLILVPLLGYGFAWCV